MPAWTVSLFFSNLFYCCVLPYVYITTRVNVEQWRTQEFCREGVQKIQLKTEDRTGIWGR